MLMKILACPLCGQEVIEITTDHNQIVTLNGSPSELGRWIIGTRIAHLVTEDDEQEHAKKPKRTAHANTCPNRQPDPIEF